MNSAKLITIAIPEEQTSIKLNINSDTTVAEVAEIIFKRPAFVNANPNQYGIALEDDPVIVFGRETKICKIPSINFVMRRIVLQVKVREDATGKEAIFGLDPAFLMKDVAVFVEAQKFSSSQFSVQTRLPSDTLTPEHDIFLITNTSLELIPSNGIRLEFERTLASYRLKSGDILLFSKAKSQSKVWTDMTGGVEIPIIISSEDFNLKKAFKFPLNYTFATVVLHFLEKANVKQSTWFYSLYLDVAGEPHEMEHSWHLSDFPLPTPARLELRKKHRPARDWFGVDPASLPLLKDPQNGIEVPEILVMLKDMLLVMGAIESEGIFRKAGLESEMTVLREKINNGEPFDSDNPHSIATLMKRWFKQIPHRLLAGADKNLSEEEMVHPEKYLTGMDLTLFNWLVCLLVLVVEKQAENKMDPKNCAIVWGPGMVGSANEGAVDQSGLGAMDGFEETRFGISVVEANVRKSFQEGVKIQNLPVPSNQQSSPTSTSQAKPRIQNVGPAMVNSGILGELMLRTQKKKRFCGGGY